MGYIDVFVAAVAVTLVGLLARQMLSSGSGSCECDSCVGCSSTCYERNTTKKTK